MTLKNWNQFHDFQADLFAGIGYQPSPEQWEVHLDTHPIRQVVGGERAGKSYLMGMDALSRMLALAILAGRDDGNYWIIGPDYRQPRQEFSYILDGLRQAGVTIEDRWLSMPRGEAAPWICEIPGFLKMQTKTGADIAKIASEALDGALYCEAAQGTFDLVLKIMGRLSEKAGWFILGGTMEKGLPWYGQLYDNWQSDNEFNARSFSIPSWANRAIYPGGRYDPQIVKLEEAYPEDLFQERMAAVPRKPRTLVYQEFDSKTHVSKAAEYDPNKQVEIFVDVGYFPGAYAVLAVQFIEGEHMDKTIVFDEVYEQRTITKGVIELCRAREWWDRCFTGAIDKAGLQHANANESPVEIWAEAGVYLATHPVGINDKLERTRSILKDPGTKKSHILIHPRCKNLINEFGLYRYPEPTDFYRNERDLPVKKYDHAMDALGYGLYDHYGPVVYEVRVPEAVGRTKVKV